MFKEGIENLDKKRTIEKKKAIKRKDFFSSQGNLDKASSKEGIFERKKTKSISESGKVVKSAEISTKNKEEILILNQNKAEEIIEKIGFLEKKKNNGEVPNNPEEEVENADKLARLIENSKYIKEQEQLLTKLNSIYESYKSAVYDNKSNKIISEIDKLSRQDENNGGRYRKRVNKIVKSENAEKINNDLKQLLKELKVRQDSKTLSAEKEVLEDKEEIIELTDEVMNIETNELEEKLEHFQDTENKNIEAESKEIQERSKKDPELRKIAEEEKERILKMLSLKKKTFSEGLANLGYHTTELKSKVLGGAMSKLSKATEGNKFLHSFFNNYAGIYDKTGKRAKNMRKTVGKGGLSKLSGAGQGAGNLFKYGRIVYDLAGSGSARGLNPFRHVTAAAMFMGRTAEAAKETRFEYENTEEKIDKKMRVKDEERAMNEAWAIYDKAFAGKSGEEVKTEDLEKAYKDNLPKDIRDRLNRIDFIGTKFCEKILNKDTKKYADRLMKKIDKIESDTSLNLKEKEVKKQELLRRNEELISDLDRMVSDQGIVDNVAFWSRFTEKVSKGVATVLVVDSVRRLASAGWNMRHIVGGWLGNEEIGKNQLVVSNFKINKPAEPQTEQIPDSPPYDPSGKPDQFNIELKQELDAGANQPKAVAVAKQEALKNIVAKVAGQEVAVKNIDIQIKGKTDTFSEAIYEAAKQADSKTQDNFIHKVLGDNEVIDDANRGKFLSQAVRELSAANIKTGDELDVQNLVYEGNVVRLKSDGSWEVLKGEGIKEAKAVSELQLRENWANAEGAKHGFEPKEVSFAGDDKNLDMRSFNAKVGDVDVAVDNHGHFSGEVGGKGFSGNISELAEGQTAKGAISEAIDSAKGPAVEQAAAAPGEAIETAEREVRDIFGVKGMIPKQLNEIARITGVDLENGIQPNEKLKLEFLAKHPELFNTPEQAQYLFNNTEAVFKLITDIRMNSGIGYGALAEKMSVSDFEGKNMFLYGKVLAGDEAQKSMRQLLGVDVEKISFGKNGRVIAELMDGKMVSILNNGQKGSIEIKEPFWRTLFKRETVARKEFIKGLSKQGLDSVKKELSGRM